MSAYSSEDGTVLGHTCVGLAKFQEAGWGCSPSIYADGTISGCEDDNVVRIAFCPWCGTRLREDSDLVEPGMEKFLLPPSARKAPAWTTAGAGGTYMKVGETAGIGFPNMTQEETAEWVKKVVDGTLAFEVNEFMDREEELLAAEERMAAALSGVGNPPLFFDDEQTDRYQEGVRS